MRGESHVTLPWNHLFLKKIGSGRLCFSVVLAFVSVLGKTKAAAPKANCSGLGDSALASLVLSVGRSLKNGSYVLILKALCLPGFKYLSFFTMPGVVSHFATLLLLHYSYEGGWR